MKTAFLFIFSLLFSIKIFSQSELRVITNSPITNDYVKFEGSERVIVGKNFKTKHPINYTLDTLEMAYFTYYKKKKNILKSRMIWKEGYIIRIPVDPSINLIVANSYHTNLYEEYIYDKSWNCINKHDVFMYKPFGWSYKF